MQREWLQKQPIYCARLAMSLKMSVIAADCHPEADMRCLVVADLHYSLPQFDWLVSAAPYFDVVIFAGDALDLGSAVDFRAQIVVVERYFSILAGLTRVVLCSGNHDLDERSEHGEKISRWIKQAGRLGIVSDGESFSLNDVLFTVCPWWDGPKTQNELDGQLKAAAAARTSRWIWIHHAPPADSPTSWGGSRHFGDVELVRWVAEHKPDMVVSGHVHQSPFVRNGSWFDKLGSTWAFNVGHQFGRPPAYMVLDLGAESAYWISAAGAETVGLNAALERPARVIAAPPDWLTALDRISSQSPASSPPAAG